MKAKPSIYITGHLGLLGSACVRRFSPDYRIITSNFDLKDEAATRSFISNERPDLLIACAAKVGGVRANRDDPVGFLEENLRIQNNVISAAAEFGVEKLVFIGTSCMFPRDAALPVREDSLLTGKLEDSVEAYAVAKIAGWRLCKAYWEQFGKKFITVCPANLFGPQDSYGLDRAHVIPALIHKLHIAMRSNSHLVVWGSGGAVREFMHADDCASAIEAVMEKYDSPEPINLGTGVSTTIKELVDMLVEISGFRGNVVWDTSEPTGIPRKTFNADKLKALGWRPSISLREGLAATWKDFVENPSPYNT